MLSGLSVDSYRRPCSRGGDRGKALLVAGSWFPATGN